MGAGFGLRLGAQVSGLGFRLHVLGLVQGFRFRINDAFVRAPGLWGLGLRDWALVWGLPPAPFCPTVDDINPALPIMRSIP